jgi:hypothetical protein
MCGSSSSGNICVRSAQNSIGGSILLHAPPRISSASGVAVTLFAALLTYWLAKLSWIVFENSLPATATRSGIDGHLYPVACSHSDNSRSGICSIQDTSPWSLFLEAFQTVLL